MSAATHHALQMPAFSVFRIEPQQKGNVMPIGPHLDSGVRAWSAFHGLTVSRRAACLHGLRGKNHCGDERCRRRLVVDHAILWNRNGSPLLLMAQVYAPTDFGKDEPGQMRDWWETQVHDYARSFGVGVWIGRPDHPLSLYYRGHHTPVLYGLGVAPYEFTHMSEADRKVRQRAQKLPKALQRNHHRRATS